MEPGNPPATVTTSPPTGNTTPTSESGSSGTSSIVPSPQPSRIPPSNPPVPARSLDERSVSSVPAQPQMSPHKMLGNLYQEHFNQLLALQAQYDFLECIPELLRQLQGGVGESDKLPFEIVYIKNGQQISLIPPGETLQQDPEMEQKLRGQLSEKLLNIHTKNGVEERASLAEEISTARGELDNISEHIARLNGEVPQFPIPAVSLIIDDQTFAARTPRHRDRLEDDAEGKFIVRTRPASAESHPSVPKESGTFTRSGSVSLPVDLNGAEPRVSEPPAGRAEVVPTVNVVDLPVGKNGQFSDIYLNKETRAAFAQRGNMASVNAGSTELSLGDGASGINGEFGRYLVQQEQIAQVQKDILNFAGNKTGMMFAEKDVLKDGPLAALYLYKTDHSDHQGSVLVDVFKDGHCPGNIGENRAMIYVIPPDGRSPQFRNTEDFLTAVRQAACNIAATQNRYNLWAREQGDLPEIPVLRMCAFSSGIYCHPGCNSADVAAAIRQGVEDFFGRTAQRQKENTIKEIQYARGMA